MNLLFTDGKKVLKDSKRNKTESPTSKTCGNLQSSSLHSEQHLDSIPNRNTYAPSLTAAKLRSVKQTSDPPSKVLPQGSSHTSHNVDDPLPVVSGENLDHFSPSNADNDDCGYDTDLEGSFIVQTKLPSCNDTNSQEVYYKAICKRLGVVPMSVYLRSLNSTECCLRYRRINDADTVAISAAMQVNRKVNKLDIVETMLSSYGTKWLSAIIRRNHQLSELSFVENKAAITKSSLKLLCEALVSNYSITRVDLSGNAIQDHMATSLCYLLRFTRSLKDLRLAYNQLSSTGGVQMSIGLKENKTLRALDLSWNHLRMTGATSIAQSLKTNSTLEILNVHMNGFGLAGAEALGEALKYNTSLIDIDISENRIPVEGAIKLAQLFTKNTTLQVLKIGMNPIQSRGSLILANLLEKTCNTSLKYLDLTNVVVLPSFINSITKIKELNPEFHVKTGCVIDRSVSIQESQDKGILEVNPLTVVITYMESKRMRILDLFKTWDKDQSLSLSREEFKHGLKSVETPLTERQLDDLMTLLDKDGSGEIELSELIEAINKDFKHLRHQVAAAVRARADPTRVKSKDHDASPEGKLPAISPSLG